MTTRLEIQRWLERGKSQDATHLIVVCDTFNLENYPVFVLPGEPLADHMKQYDGVGMQKIMEVYDLSMDWAEQLNARRIMNIKPSGGSEADNP